MAGVDSVSDGDVTVKSEDNELTEKSEDVELTEKSKDMTTVSKTGNDESEDVNKEKNKGSTSLINDIPKPETNENVPVTATNESLTTSESDQTKNIVKRSDSKPKWKLKISIGKSNSSEIVDKEDGEDQHTNIGDAENKENDELIDVGTNNEPISTDSPLPSKRKIKRKSIGIESVQPSQAKKTKGGLRSDCPPFCKANCTFDHHPLLSHARKMIENDSLTTMTFLEIVASYYEGDLSNMNYSDSIDDPWKNTSFPLLHYIALMGKCAGCFAMIDAGHTPETVLCSNGDTVLHTMTREMYIFNCTHGHMDILLKKFNLLLKEFKSCLLITNKNLQTPLHVCCSMISETSAQLSDISKNKKAPFRLYQFLKNMLLAMLEQFRNEGLDSLMLNMVDDKQNTLSHYLGRDRASHNILEEIREMGADFSICNSENQSIEKVIEDAPPGPPDSILEMAVFSAQGRKYKSLHQKPVKSASMVKTVSIAKSASTSLVKTSISPTRSTKRTIKPTFKALTFIESQYSAEKRPDEVPKVPEKKDIVVNGDVYKANNEITQTKSRPRVKITPTRQEKKDQKQAKKLLTAKENVATTEMPPSSLSKVMPIVTNPSITVSSSTPTNTPSILTGKQPNTNIATVKPTIIAPVSTPHIIVAHGKQSKLEISPLSISNNIKPPPPQPVIVNQISQVPGPSLQIRPNSLIKNQPNQIAVVTSNATKPILLKTNDGKVVQLPLQQYTNFPNTGIRMLQIPRGVEFENFQKLQQQPSQPQIRATNINGQWVYPPPNMHVQYAQPMQSPPAGMLTKVNNGVFFGPNQVVQSSTPQHFQQKVQSTSKVVGGLQPANVNQHNVGPVTVMQQPVNFKAHVNLPSGIHPKLQPPSFFPPYQVRQTQQIRTQFQPQPVRTEESYQQPAPVETKSSEPPKKRRGNLEASIRNLKNISMDIITGNNNQSVTTKTIPGEGPDKSPNQNQPPQPSPPVEESAPPVYIIDTDDEQHILSKEMMNKQQAKEDTTQTAAKNKDMAEPNQTEHIIVEKQRRCKFDVELPYNLCQHFEQFLVVHQLTYSKFDCIGHETDAETASSPSPNPFLLSESDQTSNRDKGAFSKETSAELLEWFSVNNQRLCMEHFARLIISENQDYLEHLLSLEMEELSAEQYKDMVKIEHFIRNQELQGVLSCKCANFEDQASHNPTGRTVASPSNDTPSTPSFERPYNSHYLQQQRRPYQPPSHSIPFWEDNVISQREVQHIAEGLRSWLHHHPWVSQGYFAIHYLNRSQGTISHLLRWATAPTSRQGEEVWLRIKHFLEDKELQERFSAKAKKHKQASLSSSSVQLSSPPINQSPQPSSTSSHKDIRETTAKKPATEQPSTTLSSSQPNTPSRLDPSDQPKQNIHDNAITLDDETEKNGAGQPTMIAADDTQQKSQPQHQHQQKHQHQQRSSSSSVHPTFQPSAQPVPSSYPQLTHDPFMSSFTQSDIHRLADSLSQWLYHYPIISQARFSKHVLHRTQGTLSSLLKLRCMPISRAGHEVWHKIRDFLKDTAHQEALLRQYGWSGAPAPAAVKRESEREERSRDDQHQQHTSPDNDNHKTALNQPNHPQSPSYYHPSHHHHPLPERKRSFPSAETLSSSSVPVTTPMHDPRHGNGHGIAGDLPTISVSPYKVKRLGEFDQDTVSRLAEQLKDWLDNQTRVSQGMFAQRVLSRSQGTLSLLLTRKSAPISSSGEEVWRKIREFLHDECQQRDLIQFAYQQN